MIFHSVNTFHNFLNAVLKQPYHEHAAAASSSSLYSLLLLMFLGV